MISQSTEWIKEGQYIDVKDKHDQWQVAYVLFKNKNQVKIRFDGWPSKFDEIHTLNSKKLKPFRSVIRGYTGQKKNPGIRDHWRFSIQNHEQRLLQFKEFISNLSQKTVQQLTQYLRGQNYFYIDFLMTNSYSNVTEIQKVFEYFKLHIQFSKNYINQFNKREISTWFQFQKNQENQAKNAYSQSHYQIFDSNYTIIGGYFRLSQFFKSNDKLIKQYIRPEITYESFITKIFLNSKFVQNFNTMVEKISQEETFQIPLSFYKSVFHLFCGIDKLQINKQFKKRIALILLGTIQNKVSKLEISKIKDEQKQLEELFNQMKILFFKLAEKDKVFKWLEETKMNIWVMLIQTNFLQKKIRGIQKIKEFFQALIAKNEYATLMTNHQQFKLWIISSNLLSIIFEQNQHTEVIKKGCQLVFYFYRSKTIEIKDVIYVWKACYGKHEAIKKIIFNLWTELAQYVSKNDVQIFLSPIIESHEQLQQQWQIEFVFKLTEKSFSVNEQSEIIIRMLKILYSKTIKHKKYMHNLARCFCNFDGQSKAVTEIIEECLENILKENQINFHLNFLGQIFKEFQNLFIVVPPNIISKLIEKMKSLTRYEKNSGEITQIFIIFSLILNNMQVQGTLEIQDCDKLWEIFSNTEFPILKNIFYGWIVNYINLGPFRMKSSFINECLSENIIQHIFNNILCNNRKLDYINLSIKQFQIFYLMMLDINKELEKLQYENCFHTGKIIFKIKDKELLGLKELWQMFLNCKDQQCLKQIAIFLKNIYMKPTNSCETKQKLARVETLLARVKNYLNEGIKKQNPRLVNHCIHLLMIIISDVKQNIDTFSEIKLQTKNKKHIKVYKSQSDIKDLQIFIQQPFFKIKNQIARIFNLKREQFTIINGKNEIYKEYYDLPYFLLKLSDPVFRIVVTQNIVQKFVIEYTYQNLYDPLIQLLKNNYASRQSYKILCFLQIKNPSQLYEKFLISMNGLKIEQNQETIYFYLYFIKIVNSKQVVHEEQIRLVLSLMISHLKVPVKSSLTATYIGEVVSIIVKIIKKYELKQNDSLKKQLNQNSCIYIINLLQYLRTIQNMDFTKIYKTFLYSFQIIQINQKNKVIQYLIDNKYFSLLMNEIFSNDHSEQLTNLFQRKFNYYIKTQKQSIEFYEKDILNVLFNQIYLKIIFQNNQFSSKFISFFKVFKQVLKNLTNYTLTQFLSIKTNERTFVQMILEIILSESDQPNQPNYFLFGHLCLLNCLIKRKTQISNFQIINLLMYQCLFFKEGKSKSLKRKCIFRQNISAALNCLFQIFIICKQQDQEIHFYHYFNCIIENLQELYHIDYWRNSNFWNVNINHQNKSKLGFVGLQNPGCICYMNSLLQQLYMDKKFRLSILQINSSYSECKMLQEQQKTQQFNFIDKLKDLFLQLAYSQKQYINPLFFAKSLKNSSNKPLVKVFQQMDIDEFCSILFDKIQNQVMKEKGHNFIRQQFGGLYSNQIISMQCKHSSQREQQFLSISLEVKKHISQSFQALVKSQILDGQNAYFCERCDKKVKALKRMSLKKLPKNIIISLRRFQFDFQFDAKVKINQYCEFPTELDLKQYTRQSLNQKMTDSCFAKEPEEQYQEKNQEKSELNMNIIQEFSKEDYTYVLKGIVVHSGSSENGHYYSLIRDKKQWYQFNDEKIIEFDASNIPNECFGGKDGDHIKIRNAYMLFYQSKSNFQQEQCSSDDNNLNMMTKTPQVESKISQIMAQNKKLNNYEVLFSKQYFEFIYRLMNLPTLSVNQNIYKTQTSQKQGNIDKKQIIYLNNKDLKNYYQFLMAYQLLVNIRQHDILYNIQLLKYLKYLTMENLWLFQHFFESIQIKQFVYQFFVNCFLPQKSKMIAHFMAEIINVYLQKYQKQNMKTQTFLEKSIIIELPKKVKQLIDQIFTVFVKYSINLNELCCLIRLILFNEKTQKFNFSIVDYLMRKNCLLILSDNIFGAKFTRQYKFKLLTEGRQQVQSEVQIESVSKVQNGQQNLGLIMNNFNIIGNYQIEDKNFGKIKDKQAICILYLLTKLPRMLKFKEELSLSALDHQKIQIISKRYSENNQQFLSHIQSLKADKLKKIFSEQLDTKSIIYYCKFFGMIAQDNLTFSNLLLNVVQIAFKVLQSTKFRPFFILLSEMINIQDQFSLHRRQKVLKKLQQSLKQNQKYYIETDFIQQWILKYANDSKQFLLLLYQNKNIITQILDSIRSKKIPEYDNIKSHAFPGCQKIKQKLHNIMISAEVKDYEVFSKFKQEKYYQILKQTFRPFQSNNEPEIIEIYGPHEEVFYFSDGCWNKVQVKWSEFGIVKVFYMKDHKQHSILITQDDQKLKAIRKPPKVMQQIQKMQIQK